MMQLIMLVQIIAQVMMQVMMLVIMLVQAMGDSGVCDKNNL
jgi:hypothetical protein